MPNQHPVGGLSRLNVLVLALSLRLETREYIEKIAKIALDQENNHTGSKNTANKARDFLLRTSANKYLVESVTGIYRKILYVHSYFEIRRYCITPAARNLATSNSHTALGRPVVFLFTCKCLGNYNMNFPNAESHVRRKHTTKIPFPFWTWPLTINSASRFVSHKLYHCNTQ